VHGLLSSQFLSHFPLSPDVEPDNIRADRRKIAIDEQSLPLILYFATHSLPTNNYAF
jgi:hypothetical protein